MIQDTEMIPQFEERIEKGRKEYGKGKTITITSHQQLDDLLDSL